jgi:hypothetical protein
MAVHCAECGEKLMGSVNRCWQCGKEFVSRAGTSERPPRRRTPIVGPLTGPLEAVVVDEQWAVGGFPGDGSLADRWPRRGSPFAETDSTEDRAESPSLDESRVTEYPVGAAAFGGTLAAILLGCFGLLSTLVFPFGGLILSAIGVALAIWGLNSPRRRTAICALLLCSLAFAVSAFFLAVDLYNRWN